MTAVTHRVFDDLVISNFMKIIPHNLDFDRDFGFVVGRYSDNGYAETRKELRSYFANYRKRSSSVDWILYHLMRDGHTLLRRYLRKDSGFYTLAQDVYRRVLRT